MKAKTRHFPITEFGGRGGLNLPFHLSKIVYGGYRRHKIKSWSIKRSYCQHINHPKPLASDAVTLVASVAMLRYYMDRDILRDAERMKGLPNMNFTSTINST